MNDGPIAISSQGSNILKGRAVTTGTIQRNAVCLIGGESIQSHLQIRFIGLVGWYNLREAVGRSRPIHRRKQSIARTSDKTRPQHEENADDDDRRDSYFDDRINHTPLSLCATYLFAKLLTSFLLISIVW